MWAIIWRILVGIGVIVGVLISVWELDNHFATCQMVKQVEKESVETLKSIQKHTDLRLYDFALQSIERDIKSDCSSVNPPSRCKNYEEERIELKKKKEQILDSLIEFNK